MFLFLSKLLPLFVYPLGLACIFLLAALLLRRRLPWPGRLTVIALLLLWLAGNPLISMALVRSLEWRYVPVEVTELRQVDAEVIIVLGGATRSVDFPRALPEINEAGDRLIYAAWLYQQQVAPRLVVSGGQPVWAGATPTTEAESMTWLLETMGVPPEAVWQEDRSRNTHENAVQVAALLQAANVERAILVTSARHMPRSARIFARTDLEITPAPTDFTVTRADWSYRLQSDWRVQIFNLLPTADNLQQTTQTLKEYIGIVVYGLRGWL